MTEWGVIEIIIALVGLGLTVGGPILVLNKNIVTLTVTLQYVQKKQTEQGEEIQDLQRHAKESHKAIWEHNDEQDRTIADHEVRLQLIEKS